MPDKPSHPEPNAPRELHEKTAEAIAQGKDRPVSEVGADDLKQADETIRRKPVSPEDGAAGSDANS